RQPATSASQQKCRGGCLPRHSFLRRRVSVANWDCSVRCLSGKGGSTMRWGQRTLHHRLSSSVNSCSSVWFKSEMAQYFIPLFVQARMLYPRRVVALGEAILLVVVGRDAQ